MNCLNLRLIRILFVFLVFLVSDFEADAQDVLLHWDLQEGSELKINLQQEIVQEAISAGGEYKTILQMEFDIVWKIVGFQDLHYQVDQTVENLAFDFVGQPQEIHAETDESKNKGPVPETIKSSIKQFLESSAKLNVDRLGNIELISVQGEPSEKQKSTLRHADIVELISQQIVVAPIDSVAVGEEWMQQPKTDSDVKHVSLQCILAGKKDESLFRISTQSQLVEEDIQKSFEESIKATGNTTVVKVSVGDHSGEGEFVFDAEKKIPVSAKQKMEINVKLTSQQVVERKISTVTKTSFESGGDED